MQKPCTGNEDNCRHKQKTTMKAFDPNKIFFTSDTHFGSEMILDFCRRPFGSSHEMDEELIRLWNETVPEDGVVFHLGDFCDTENASDYLRKLNGTIHLIAGNHDRIQEDCGFRSISEQQTIYVEGQRIILNHYPMLCFGGERTCTWQLFGHVHSGGGNTTGYDLSRLGMLFPRQYDVGVDNNGFRPISFASLKSIIDSRSESY